MVSLLIILIQAKHADALAFTLYQITEGPVWGHMYPQGVWHLQC